MWRKPFKAYHSDESGNLESQILDSRGVRVCLFEGGDFYSDEEQKAAVSSVVEALNKGYKRR